jgi:hypothetical protein
LECRPLGRAWMLVSATGDVMDIWGMGRTWGPFKNPVYIYIYTYIYNDILIYIYTQLHSTLDGRNMAPVGRWLIPLEPHYLQRFIVTISYKLVQDLVHPVCLSM